MNSHLLIPFIIISALSITATLEAGSPTSSPAGPTLVNSFGDKVKLVGVEFGHDQIFVTLQNAGDKDIAKACMSVHFSDSRGPYLWTGTPTRGHGDDYDPCLHNLGAHRVVKISLTADPSDADDLKDFKQVLGTKKKYVIASLLVDTLVFKDNSTGDHTQ